MSASNTQQFGQEMMRVLDRGQLELRSRFAQMIDEFIKQSPNLLRRGPLTTYSVEDLLTRLRNELLQSSADLLQRFVGVSSRQIFEVYKAFAGALEQELASTIEQLNQTRKKYSETMDSYDKESSKTQTLANLIEEADASISQLMEERESLNTSISETIKKLKETEKIAKDQDQKIKDYEQMLNKMQSESSAAIDTLTKKLKDQEVKWKEKLESEKQLFELKLLNAYKNQETSNVAASQEEKSEN
jgi:DNA repair exonuclease SbcCD ATPase subunit